MADNTHENPQLPHSPETVAAITRWGWQFAQSSELLRYAECARVTGEYELAELLHAEIRRRMQLRREYGEDSAG